MTSLHYISLKKSKNTNHRHISLTGTDHSKKKCYYLKKDIHWCFSIFHKICNTAKVQRSYFEGIGSFLSDYGIPSVKFLLNSIYLKKFYEIKVSQIGLPFCSLLMRPLRYLNVQIIRYSLVPNCWLGGRWYNSRGVFLKLILVLKRGGVFFRSNSFKSGT